MITRRDAGRHQGPFREHAFATSSWISEVSLLKQSLACPAARPGGCGSKGTAMFAAGYFKLLKSLLKLFTSKYQLNWKHYKRGIWQWQRHDIVATVQKTCYPNVNPWQTQIFTWDYMKTLWKWKCMDAFSCNKNNCLQFRWYSVTIGGKFGNTDY